MKKLFILLTFTVMILLACLIGFVLGYGSAVDEFGRRVFMNPGYYWIDARGNIANTDL